MINPKLIEKLENAKGMAPNAIARDIKKINLLINVDIDSAIIKIFKVSDLILRVFFNFNSTQKEIDKSVWDKLIQPDIYLKKISPRIKLHFNIIKNTIEDFFNVEDNFVSKEKDPEIEDIQYSIESFSAIINWYVTEILPFTDDDYDIEIYTGKSITEEMVKQASEIDFEVFPKGYIADTKLCIEWLHRNSEIYIMAFDSDTKKVVGYLNAMPLDDNYFLQYENGSIVDSDIPVSAIRNYTFPGFYKLLLCSIAISPNYQGTLIFRMIFDAFMDKLITLSEKNIFISELLADAVTGDGKRLSEYFGMKFVRNGKNGELYKVNLFPPSIRNMTSKSKVFQEIYTQKYIEFKDILDVNPTSHENLKELNISPDDNLEPIKILFIGINPRNTQHLRIDEEVRELGEALRVGKYRDKFTLIQKWAVRTTDLVDAIIEQRPKFIHFSGHGYSQSQTQGGLAFEDHTGNIKIIDGEAMGFLLKSIPIKLRDFHCFIMNACFSSEQAHHLLDYIPYIIGMSNELDDRAAIIFSSGFYRSIGHGNSIEDSFNIGCSLLKLEGFGDSDMPIIMKGKSN